MELSLSFILVHLHHTCDSLEFGRYSYHTQKIDRLIENWGLLSSDVANVLKS